MPNVNQGILAAHTKVKWQTFYTTTYQQSLPRQSSSRVQRRLMKRWRMAKELLRLRTHTQPYINVHIYQEHGSMSACVCLCQCTCTEILACSKVQLQHLHSPSLNWAVTPCIWAQVSLMEPPPFYVRARVHVTYTTWSNLFTAGSVHGLSATGPWKDVCQG